MTKGCVHTQGAATVRLCIPYPSPNTTVAEACEEAISLADTPTISFSCVLGGDNCTTLVSNGGADITVLDGTHLPVSKKVQCCHA